MRSVRWLFEVWRTRKRLATFLVVFSILNALLAVAYPLFVRAVIDAIKNKAGVEVISRNVLILLALGIGQFLVYASMQGTRAWTNLVLERDFRQRMFGHLIRLGRSFFQRFRMGDIVTRLTDDLSTEMKLSWFACSGIFRTIEALCMIVFGLAAMIRLNPTLTLFAVGPLPILIIIFMLTSAAVEARYERLQKRISDVNAHMESCFSGIRVVKAYRRERAQEEGFGEVIGRRRRAEIDAVRVGTIVQAMYGHIWQFGVVIVLLVGGKMVMEGKLTIGTLAAFDAYVMLLVFPMYDIGTFFVRGKSAAVSIRRLADMEDVQPEITEIDHPKVLPWAETTHGWQESGGGAHRTQGRAGGGSPRATLPGTLRFDNVSLSFTPGGAKVLDGVSFEVKPGEIVALVGRVASGKSSVVNLIPRLVDPTEGRILLDGVPIRDLGLEDLRGIIGYVPQEPLLFSDTVENNIRFHRDWIGREDVARAAEVSRLVEEVGAFSDGFQTKIGQRGVTISGGQKQRVALARALAGRPKILILDDCTASLDAQTETALWEGLQKVFPQCATIVISHRAATLERADLILVFERGKIVERGAHHELVSKKGVYHTLYELGKLRDEVGTGWEE
ncbi:MAG: ABC transporter ATP-binding protein [Candidatus Eisenbacteria bacterium]|nr:ABC transporter ATP-binding protein [Candidatus Eisenbacteria bacterium]